MVIQVIDVRQWCEAEIDDVTLCSRLARTASPRVFSADTRDSTDEAKHIATPDPASAELELDDDTDAPQKYQRSVAQELALVVIIASPNQGKLDINRCKESVLEFIQKDVHQS